MLQRLRRRGYFGHDLGGDGVGRQPFGQGLIRQHQAVAQHIRHQVCHVFGQSVGSASQHGQRPRATITLTEGARALAMLRGRSYALPEDMTDLVPDVLRHRLVMSYEALSEGLTADAITAKIMAKVPAPAKPLEHEKLAA